MTLNFFSFIFSILSSVFLILSGVFPDYGFILSCSACSCLGWLIGYHIAILKKDKFFEKS